MAGSSAWIESLSRWPKLKANKMPSVDFCTERTAWGVGLVAISFTLFMLGLRFSSETKSPATFSEAGLKKTGLNYFRSLCSPAGHTRAALGLLIMDAVTKRCGAMSTAAGHAVKAPAFFSITRLHINMVCGTLHRNKDMSNGGNV